MKAVILYDQLERAAHAQSALCRAASRLEEPEPIEIDPWRIDLLAYQHAREVAMGDMLDADLVVLALGKQGAIASTLLQCLEHWAEVRQVGDAGLAIFEEEQAGCRCAPRGDLHRLAGRYGLSFISGVPDSTDGREEGFADDPDSLHRRQVAQTSIMQQMLARTADCVRRV